MENRSVMIVFREGIGHWWKAWDGARHYTDTWNFKNSLWQCIKDVGRIGNHFGIVFLNEEAYGVQDNPSTFRPMKDLDIEVLSNGVDMFNVITWDKIPEVFHNNVLSNVPSASRTLRNVEFDLEDGSQFLVWVDVKMFGIGALSPEGN